MSSVLTGANFAVVEYRNGFSVTTAYTLKELITELLLNRGAEIALWAEGEAKICADVWRLELSRDQQVERVLRVSQAVHDGLCEKLHEPLSESEFDGYAECAFCGQPIIMSEGEEIWNLDVEAIRRTVRATVQSPQNPLGKAPSGAQGGHQ